MLDDPDAPTIYRTSSAAPFPDPHDAQPFLPVDLYPRQVTLRDRITVATIVPFTSRHQVPQSLLSYLSDQLNKEIEMGDTYPMIDTMSMDKFGSYWFQNFGAVMLLGSIESADEVTEGKNWATQCLGSFYVKPNYPGRSSHVCNAGFLVTDAARNKGVGRLMGEAYLDWAPRLGYAYSVFNLVYETNVASCRIWDALGFKRIGRVKGAGNLKSYPGQLIDAIIYGRDLGSENTDTVSEERFDKIAFYLRYGKYPAGADRAEKSRLRSAATHYKLLENDKLMLKDKEVISDPQKQYEIARNVHVQQHGGINKTTATIAEKYHWVRIKETVSLVIRNCTECKELGKAPVVRADGSARRPLAPPIPTGQGSVSAAGRILSLPHPSPSPSPFQEDHHQQHQPSVSPQVLNRTLPGSSSTPSQIENQMGASQHHPSAPIPQMQTHHRRLRDDYMPLDPQIMEDVRQHLGSYNSVSRTSSHPHDHSPAFTSHNDLDHAGPDESFQAMLGGIGTGAGGMGNGNAADQHGVDANGDLDMLIDQEDDGSGLDESVRPADEESGLQIRAEAAARAAEETLRGGGRGYGKG